METQPLGIRRFLSTFRPWVLCKLFDLKDEDNNICNACLMGQMRWPLKMLCKL